MFCGVRTGILSGGGNDFFRVSEFTGSGVSKQIITRQNIKDYGAMLISLNVTESDACALIDTVRGLETYTLTNTTAGDSVPTAIMDSFDINGFTVDSYYLTNGTGDSIAILSFLQKEGLLHIRSYTPTGSAGLAVSHDLGAAPAMYWCKRRGTSQSWGLRHKSLASNGYLQLNASSPEQIGSTFSESSTQVTLPAVTEFNASTTTDDFMGYFFGEVTGKSKFGEYTGTGSAGNAITGLGFKPDLVFIQGKSIGESAAFFYKDASGTVKTITLETAIQTTPSFTLDADGFTPPSGGYNQSGETYVYGAWRKH